MNSTKADARMVAVIGGEVQGVGFRWWTKNRAGAIGLRGSATNLPDGRVQVVAEGRRDGCEELLAHLRANTPGRVDDVDVTWGEPAGEPDGFRVG